MPGQSDYPARALWATGAPVVESSVPYMLHDHRTLQSIRPRSPPPVSCIAGHTVTPLPPHPTVAPLSLVIGAPSLPPSLGPGVDSPNGP
jgi:hypothetical protein